jgi:hypothetical protein
MLKYGHEPQRGGTQETFTLKIKKRILLDKYIIILLQYALLLPVCGCPGSRNQRSLTI